MQFTPTQCPHCNQTTSLVHIGGEPARKICGRFGCDWSGESL